MGIAGGLWRVGTRVMPPVCFSIPTRRRMFRVNYFASDRKKCATSSGIPFAS
jgi:hypothetical protein